MLIRIAILLFVFNLTQAQNIPLGQWEVHVPYTSATDIAIQEDKIWGVLENALTVIDVEDNAINKITKASGLSDVNPVAIAVDTATASIIVAYSNANIDIIRNGSIINIPAIKNANIIGSKRVNQLRTYNGFAYVATGFGIVEIDINGEEIKDSYFIGLGNSNLNTNDVYVDADYIYAATEDGVIRGNKSPFVNLSNANDTTAWLRYNFETNGIPETNTEAINALGNQLYAVQGAEVFKLDINSRQWNEDTMFENWVTKSLDQFNNSLYFAQEETINGFVTNARILSFDGQDYATIQENNGMNRPRGAAIYPSGNLWIADEFQGVLKAQNGFANAFIANGPYKNTALKMDASEGKVFIASSNLNPNLPSNDDDNLPYGFYVSENQQWTNYNEFNAAALQGSFDIADLAYIPTENKVLIGTDGAGMIEMDLGTGEGNTMLTPPNSNQPYRCVAVESDDNGNVWFANSFSTGMPLACRKPNGEYVYFTSRTGALLNKVINDIAIDESNLIYLSTISNGIYVYDYNNTLDDQSDDQISNINTNFNLNSNNVKSIAVDQDNALWIGTIDGVGVLSCNIFAGNCAVQQPCIPREDTTNFCDNLLVGEFVNAIAVDPANRKWFGTNGGLFLQSSNGEESIYAFTVDNSPLLSNTIRSIAIDEQTGDVFIATDRGINSFRAEATNTDENASDDPIVYPNPVRPEYKGPIAIKNLANNSVVKILDVAGFLVHETRALGGQAIWDGNDPNGDRAKSGVYIVLSASDDGSTKRSTKFVLIN